MEGREKVKGRKQRRQKFNAVIHNLSCMMKKKSFKFTQQSAILFLVKRGSNGHMRASLAAPRGGLGASVQPIRFSPLAVVSGRPAWPASAEPQCSSYST